MRELSPMAHRATHWKQVLFMFGEPLAVKAGDMVRGNIQVQRNSYWKRHFETTIEFELDASTNAKQGVQTPAKKHKQKFELWR